MQMSIGFIRIWKNLLDYNTNVSGILKLKNKFKGFYSYYRDPTGSGLKLFFKYDDHVFFPIFMMNLYDNRHVYFLYFELFINKMLFFFNYNFFSDFINGKSFRIQLVFFNFLLICVFFLMPIYIFYWFLLKLSYFYWLVVKIRIVSFYYSNIRSNFFVQNYVQSLESGNLKLFEVYYLNMLFFLRNLTIRFCIKFFKGDYLKKLIRDYEVDKRKLYLIRHTFGIKDEYLRAKEELLDTYADKAKIFYIWLFSSYFFNKIKVIKFFLKFFDKSYFDRNIGNLTNFYYEFYNTFLFSFMFFKLKYLISYIFRYLIGYFNYFYKFIKIFSININKNFSFYYYCFYYWLIYFFYILFL